MFLLLTHVQVLLCRNNRSTELASPCPTLGQSCNTSYSRKAQPCGYLA